MLKPRIEAHHDGGILIAEFWDCLRLDPGAVQGLRAMYEEHVKAGGRPEVVIDLLGVGFAGSAALGHFVALQRVVRGKSGRLIFCNVEPTVFEVFRVSKLDPLFVFVADRAAAVELARNPAENARNASGDSESSASAGSPPLAAPPRKSGGGGLLRASRRRKL